MSAQDMLKFNVEYSLTHLLNMEIDKFGKLEQEKKLLADDHNFNLQAVFEQIDTNKARNIDFNNISEFLEKKLGKVADEDVTAFIRRLDKNLDCMLSYEEFEAGLKPSNIMFPPHESITVPKTEAPKFGTGTLTQPEAKNSISGPQAATAQSNPENFADPDSLPKPKDIISEMIDPKEEKKNLPLQMRNEMEGQHTQENLGMQPKYSPEGMAKNQEGVDIQFLQKTPESSDKKTKATLGLSPLSGNKSSPTRQFHRNLAEIKGKELLKPTQIIKSQGPDDFCIRDLMALQLENEAKIELLKYELYKNQDITYPVVAYYLDPENKGVITSEDIVSVFKKLGIKATEMDVYMLLKRLFKNIEGEISTKDFILLLFPELSERRKGISQSELSKTSLEALTDILAAYLENVKMDEESKNELLNKDLSTMFECFDIRNSGHFNKDDVFIPLYLIK
jgi:Ca2+-binding EF-hand superfamily protein